MENMHTDARVSRVNKIWRNSVKEYLLSISFKSAFFFLHVGDIKKTKFKGKTKH